MISKTLSSKKLRPDNSNHDVKQEANLCVGVVVRFAVEKPGFDSLTMSSHKDL